MPNSLIGDKPNQVPPNHSLGRLARMNPEDIVPGYLHVRDEKASGTNGGNTTGGAYNDRTLNTVVTNTIQGASLSSNHVTLPAGTYEFSARAASYSATGVTNLGLYNVTDSAVIITGDTGVGDGSISFKNCDGRFTIAAAKTVKLRQWFQNTVTNGLGSASNIAGVAEVYASLIIRKVA